MDTKELIGLEVCKVLEILEKAQANFKFVYYSDRKQQKFDKEIVTAVRQRDGYLEIVVCRYLLEV